LVLVGLAATTALFYGAGLRRLWSAAGSGRGISRGRAAAFTAGLVALAVALVSPLDPLGDALFSAHMAQHLALILVAAPLLVAGAPRLAMLWALPQPWRGRVGGAVARGVGRLTRPVVAFAAASASLWLWHLPRAYQAALARDPVHAVEHASFLGTALLFWWVVLQPEGRRGLSRGAAILYVLAMAVESSALGALITFSPRLLYAAHVPWTAAWGLSPLQDQQLAGLIMWVPAGFVYLGVMGWLFLGWLEESDASWRRRVAGRTT
jgi:cytochrome c oxidase assembly factor CtaG